MKKKYGFVINMIINKIKIRNWLVLRRQQSDYGLWFIPGTEYLIGVLSGLMGFAVSSDVITGFISGISGLICVRLFSALLGYIDKRWFHIIEYRNEWTSRSMNPFFRDMDIKLNSIIDILNKEGRYDDEIKSRNK